MSQTWAQDAKNVAEVSLSFLSLQYHGELRK